VAGGAVQGGIGAGPAHVLDGPAAATLPAPRSVVVARRPWPQLAPLLWQSAGLVTRGGTAGAHLFEVARSLGVPTVTGVDLGRLGPGSLLAVDGSEGVVSVLPGPAIAPEPLAELVGSR
jgi:phosphohistidine swiveling domain-containing protein